MEPIEPYDRRVEAAPDDGAAYLSRGKCHMRNGSFELGRADFEKALEHELDPDAPPDERGIRYERPNASDARLQLGAALVELGQLDAAAEQMELGLRLNGSEAAYTARGAVKLLRGDLAGALGDLNVALQKDPRSDRALRHRAKCHERLGDHAAAERDRAVLAQRQAREPELPHDWLQRGFAREQRGDIAGALSDFQKYQQLLPSDVHGPLQQGRVLLDAGRIEEAAVQLERAAALAPHDVSVGYHQGLLRLAQGDASAAIAYFDQILPRAVDWYAGFRPLALRARAQAHDSLGNAKAAAADLEAAAAAEEHTAATKR